ncbi:hypothetical protein [Streptomyces sp. UNOB3_S3]|uniref:hypothetical protein n=1 Tax=Streptomyces sp. UNOB3_S3 TaxID=2871682 RepID=UPI001E4074E4|nr:hypothetical protein [Streptomyces sp. UNOB3_S3]MCC3774596.1 hypothetical protein [Streptomyces sp. UNOB3_S3]
MTTNTMLTAGVPAVVLLALCLLRRRSQPVLMFLVREVRDLVTLRMVLRGSEPDERADLLAAHRKWRAESEKRPRKLAPSGQRRVRERAVRRQP